MRTIFSIFILLLFHLIKNGYGFGSMGPIAAAFGGETDTGFFCAIDAGGKQEVICWAKNATFSPPSPLSSSQFTSAATYSNELPAMAALSGGEGFLCGILANTSQAYCWRPAYAGASDLVPSSYRNIAYSHIAAGRSHVCGIRGAYYLDHDSGTVDCWEIVKRKSNTTSSNDSWSSVESSGLYNQEISNLTFDKLVSGEGYSCGEVRGGGVVCWGPNTSISRALTFNGTYEVLASGRDSVCGILEDSKEISCWGEGNSSFSNLPTHTRFVSLSAGADHFCGIREDDHSIECWGSFNSSAVPRAGSGFMAIASSNYITCGIREDNLVIECWSANGTFNLPEYSPPLELFSPGLCSPGSCGHGMFAFNASTLNEPDLTSLCLRQELNICSSCGFSCSQGYFLSSPCNQNADRVCTACSLCQNSSCWDVCGLQPSQAKQWRQLYKLVIVIGSSALGLLLILLSWCILPRFFTIRKEVGSKKYILAFIRKPESETDVASDCLPPPSVAPCPGIGQSFRLSELKDATNGFKEFNELGRGSYGFVYKAVLVDGRQVAVKRANATTIIHTNSRDFEVEVEVLCNIRHCNIVNLLGYCAEMGERLLVYEYMPHGTLHDHLHNEITPLSWNLRLKIAMNAGKGLEYLHKEAQPSIVHRNVKTSNILLDSDWGGRIADFGLLAANEKELGGDVKSDVYDFGIVLLEILSGRKAFDTNDNPPNIVDWAVPLIKQGKGAALIDRCVALPRNVEPLLKLADIAELAVRDDPGERPSMSNIANWLEQIVKDELNM